LSDMDLLTRLDPNDDSGLTNVVIDTPARSAAKFKFDDVNQCYRLTQLLPLGAIFPYNFGSIPKTVAEDGDPLDVLVLTDVPLPVGSLVSVALIGVLFAKQTTKGKEVRNDRLLGVAMTDAKSATWRSLDDLDDSTLRQIEQFFVWYNAAHDRTFTPLGRGKPAEAHKVVRDAAEAFNK